MIIIASLYIVDLKNLNQVAEFSTKGQIVEQERYGLTQDGNTLAEIDLLKDYYPYAGNHIIRKRNVGEPLGNPEAGTPTKRRRRRRRRRRKKVSHHRGRPSYPDQFKPSNENGERPTVQAIFEGTINGPIDNILDPSGSKRRSSRRKPRPQVETPFIDALPEKPMLSEIAKEDTDGLLRAKELQANYINTDMMRANKLKADRIRADKIKAQDVIVTAKKSRRKRPSTREYIQPEPVYERTGTQRFNSVVDSPIYDPHTVAIPGRQNVYDAMPNRPQNDHSQINNEFIQQRHSNRDILFPQQETFTKRRYEEPNVVSHTLPVMEHHPAIRPTEPLPEFSSSKIVNKYAGKQPIMSEFVAEPPSFRSNNRRLEREKIRGRTLEKYNPSTDFFGFDNPDAHFGTGTGSSRSHDKTSKTYITKSDPWYFR